MPHVPRPDGEASTFWEGVVVNPASSTSLISAGKSVAQRFIFWAMSSVTTLTTNSPVRRNVPGRVLGNGGLVGHADADDWRVCTQVVVCAEECRVQAAIFIHAGMSAIGRGATKPTSSL
jgi:hypothetical protein